MAQEEKIKKKKQAGEEHKTGISDAVLEDALKSLEAIENATGLNDQTPKDDQIYELDVDEDSSEDDLKALLNLLEDAADNQTGESSADQADEWADPMELLLNETEDEVDDENLEPLKDIAPVVAPAEDVEGGDEIIAQLLGGPVKDLSPAKKQDADVAPRPEKPAANGKAKPDRQFQELLDQKDSQIRLLIERLETFQSEVEKSKKRMEREIEDSKRFANDALLLEVLPILDSMERAISHADQQQDPKAYEEGVLLIYKQFQDVLSNLGIQRIEAVGQTFDPNFHEAMVHVEDSSKEPNTVTVEYNPGYLVHGRLLRPSKVVVTKGQGEG